METVPFSAPESPVETARNLIVPPPYTGRNLPDKRTKTVFRQTYPSLPRRVLTLFL